MFDGACAHALTLVVAPLLAAWTKPSHPPRRVGLSITNWGDREHVRVRQMNRWPHMDPNPRDSTSHPSPIYIHTHGTFLVPVWPHFGAIADIEPTSNLLSTIVRACTPTLTWGPSDPPLVITKTRRPSAPPPVVRMHSQPAHHPISYVAVQLSGRCSAASPRPYAHR